MKGTFIAVFLLVDFIALLKGIDLRAQQAPGKLIAMKSNFSTFTRKKINRGKLWMAKNKNYVNHPDAGFDDKFSPANAVEFFGKRTIDSKFYINKDTPSIIYVQRSSSPMHFKKNGQWITIDTRLSPKGPLVYEASNQEHPLGFDIRRKSSYIITSDGRTYFNNWTLYGENGRTETLLAKADWTNYTVGDDGIAFKNIFPGIDAEMKVSRGSIKTSFIVHNNKFSNYKTLLFRDSFLAGHPGNFTFSDGLKGNGFASAVDFRVSARTVFHIKEGIIYQEKNPSSAHQLIPYFLDRNKLTLSVSADFLNTHLNFGDVIIDPLVQDFGVLNKDKIKGSQFNQDCSLTKACDYSVNVPGPPGTTFVSAFFSFGVTAHDPCVGTDGAFSFAVKGECGSQLWIGTDPGAGSQFYTNQDMRLNNGGSLVGCFPVQDKSNCSKPQNVPFNFYFYRRCVGHKGCEGDCIGAAEALTITLVGRTFDSASIKESTNNICAGTPVTLTASGYYGIPPYNFNWVGLNQNSGDSAVRVNPTADAIYTVQVSDACTGILGASVPIAKSISVHVLPKPPKPTLTSNSPVCAGEQLILSVPAIAGTKYLIKNLANGLGGIYESNAVFSNVTAAYSGTWIAVATDANGCTSDTARVNVVINPLISPTVTITSSATNICTGSPVSFTATVTNGGNSPTYQWLLNGNKVGTNSAVYSNNSFADNDQVSCVVTATGPCVGGSGTSNTIVLKVSSGVSPTFAAIGPFCQNSTPPELPLTSQDGIHGTWSPATINTSALGATLYTFTPAAGSCAVPVSISISVVSGVVPTFSTIPKSLCQNTTPPPLPTSSNEGIDGTWSPATINTSGLGAASYTFTPSAGSCATPVNVSISIVSTLVPTFPTVPNSLCQGSTAPALPTSSSEGIGGTWNPSSISTSALGTSDYTFTPSNGQCATALTLKISVVNSLVPTFPTIPTDVCQNATAPVLPSKSVEGINGTWNPSTVNTSTVGSDQYTFTPASGQCGSSAQVTIVINPLPVLTMGPDLTIVSGASVTMNVSVTGNIDTYQWSPTAGLNDPTIKDPVANPSATTVYTLNVSDENHCVATGKIKITVTGGSSKISIPNAFSPNGDGINDTWIITNLSNFPGATVDVFNRYGQLIFHSENNKSWDGTYNGKVLPMGTYYYIIDLKNNEKKIAGSVTLFK